MTLPASTAAKPTARSARVAHLDGIRALAILSVVAFHWFGGRILGLFHGGYIGVDVFLALSGYLITSILVRRSDQTLTGYLRFMRARVRRLYPALLGLTVGVFLITLLGHGKVFDLLRPSLPSYAVTLLQVSWIPVIGDWGSHGQAFIHTWSLAVEWTFYVVWPWLLWRTLGRRRHAWLLVALVAVAVWLACAAVLPWQWFYASPLARSAQLGAGCALALFAAPRGGSRVFAEMPRVAAEAMFVVAFLAVSGWAVLGPLAGASYRWGVFALVPLGTVAMIAGGHRSRVAHWLVRLPAVTAVGVASYSIYLWHVPWMLIFNADLLGISHGAVALGTLLMTALTAAISYWFLERPYFRSR